MLATSSKSDRVSPADPALLLRCFGAGITLDTTTFSVWDKKSSKVCNVEVTHYYEQIAAENVCLLLPCYFTQAKVKMTYLRNAVVSTAL